MPSNRGGTQKFKCWGSPWVQGAKICAPNDNNLLPDGKGAGYFGWFVPLFTTAREYQEDII